MFFCPPLCARPPPSPLLRFVCQHKARHHFAHMQYTVVGQQILFVNHSLDTGQFANKFQKNSQFMALNLQTNVYRLPTKYQTFQYA